MCVLGNRLLKDIHISNCTKFSRFLNETFCTNSAGNQCDAYYFNNNVTVRNGIKGLSSGVFFGKFTFTRSYDRT